MLSAGLLAGTVGIASAATQSSAAKSDASAKADASVSFEGTVTVVANGSVTVVNAKGITQVFTITSSTKVLRIANVKNPATLAVGERVEVRAMASAKSVATTINILGAKAKRTVSFQGTVTVLANGTVSVINAKAVTQTFTITTTTKVLRASNVKHPATLAVGERVVVRTLTSAPSVATTINIVGAKK